MVASGVLSVDSVLEEERNNGIVSAMVKTYLILPLSVLVQEFKVMRKN